MLNVLHYWHMPYTLSFLKKKKNNWAPLNAVPSHFTKYILASKTASLCVRLNMRFKIFLLIEADSSFAAEFLQAHNEYRSKHGAPPLSLDPNLNLSAQAWAQTLLSIKTLKHSNAKVGENLYYTYSSPPKKVPGK